MKDFIVGLRINYYSKIRCRRDPLLREKLKGFICDRYYGSVTHHVTFTLTIDACWLLLRHFNCSFTFDRVQVWVSLWKRCTRTHWWFEILLWIIIGCFTCRNTPIVNPLCTVRLLKFECVGLHGIIGHCLVNNSTTHWDNFQSSFWCVVVMTYATEIQHLN